MVCVWHWSGRATDYQSEDLGLSPSVGISIAFNYFLTVKCTDDCKQHLLLNL